MTRYVVLGNQRLLINMDDSLQVRDVYYPMVGEENHVQGHTHRIGVYLDNQLHWINKESWEIKLRYKKDTLVTDSMAINKDLGLEIRFNETVLWDENIFIRRLEVKNPGKMERRIKIFFAQDFHLYGTGFGDTAVYQADRNIVVHYKRSRYFLINILRQDNTGPKGDIDDYAIGAAEWQGKDGTYRDAEDGLLSKNPIAQGSIDSTVAITLEIKPGGSEEFYYILCAGRDFQEVYHLNDLVLKKMPGELIKGSIEHEKQWVGSHQVDLTLVDESTANLFKRSLLIIKSQFDQGGAIIAANDSDNMEFNMDTYSYMWPRDGALVATALIKAGFAPFTKPFFQFVKDLLWEDGYLLHKYNPDGTLGSSWHPWVEDGKAALPIQEDETALVIHAFWEYFKETRDKGFLDEIYEPFIKKAAEFLKSYRYDNGLPKESHDLWEERRGIFTFTASAVCAGLKAAEKLGEIYDDGVFCASCASRFDELKKAITENLYDENLGRFVRGLKYHENDLNQRSFDTAIDASLYGIFAFGALPPDDPKVTSTMEKIYEELWVKNGIGGVSRYHGDLYHQVEKDFSRVPGNPWIICTLWLARWHVARARTNEDLERALPLIRWVMEHALSTGILPEQLHPYNGDSLSVSPLTWSHAEFVETVTNYVIKKKLLLGH